MLLVLCLLGGLKDMIPETPEESYRDKKVIFYKDTNAYQKDGGFHDIFYNISANGSEPFGNGNREFPWSKGGGMHRCPSVKSIKFILLPDQWPIVWWRQGDRIRWCYPVGTKVGEVLYTHEVDGDYAFEMRVRERIYGDWAVEIYRPYPTAQDLRDALAVSPDFEGKVRLEAHLYKTKRFKKMALTDAHPRKAFNFYTHVDNLPPISFEGKKILLQDKIFYPALGEYWENPCICPTTEAEYQIIPRNYDAAFAGTSPSSCMECHKHTGKHVNEFDFRRDWYGRIRGDDGVFSFPIHDPRCVSHNGFHQEPVITGAVKFNSSEHPHHIYQLRDAN